MTNPALTCWCGAPATYADYADPAVTSVVALVLPDGLPGVPHCDDHPGSFGGYRIAAPFDPDYDLAVRVRPIAPDAHRPWWEPTHAVSYREGASA